LRRAFACDRLEFLVNAGAIERHLSAKNLRIEIRIIKVVFDDFGGFGEESFVEFVGGEFFWWNENVLAEHGSKGAPLRHQVLNADQQFFSAEWFYEVVVGTDFEALDFAFVRRFCSEIGSKLNFNLPTELAYSVNLK
jgi:hypothetical protein